MNKKQLEKIKKEIGQKRKDNEKIDWENMGRTEAVEKLKATLFYVTQIEDMAIGLLEKAIEKNEDKQ